MFTVLSNAGLVKLKPLCQSFRPRYNRYKAPIIFTAKNAGAEYRMTVLKPSTANKDIINKPLILPRMVNIDFLIPYLTLFKATSIIAGPGVIVAMRAMDMKSNRLSKFNFDPLAPTTINKKK